MGSTIARCAGIGQNEEVTILRNTLLLSAAALLAVPAGPALAGGFEIPDNGTFTLGRGGAFIVRADDPTALVHNPGGLARLRGTHLLYNHVLIWEDATFTRAESELPPGQATEHDPLAPVSNEKPLFPLGLMVAMATDFGLDDWTFALGLYGPHSHGQKKYPLQGGQRYMLTELETLVLYTNLSVAYGVEDVFGVGLTLQYAMAPRVRLSVVSDGTTGTPLNAYYSPGDAETTLELKDMAAFSAIVGAWWRVAPELELGLSGRIIPVNFDLEGTVAAQTTPNSPLEIDVVDSNARLRLTIPPSIKAGVRYRHLDGEDEVFDVELNVVYEAWSMVSGFDAKLSGTIVGDVSEPLTDTETPKRWRDTVSVRLGGTVSLLEGLELSLGGYWESAAVPQNYEHLDFMSFARVGLGIGVRGQIGPVRLSVAYSHVFQETREVSERFGKVYQVRPLRPCPDRCGGYSGVPANAGRFESAYDMLAFGLEAMF